MAKNLDVNIDAGDFLDSFRPELPPPTSPKAGMKGETETEEKEKKEDVLPKNEKSADNGQGKKEAKNTGN